MSCDKRVGGKPRHGDGEDGEPDRFANRARNAEQAIPADVLAALLGLPQSFIGPVAVIAAALCSEPTLILRFSPLLALAARPVAKDT